MRLVTLVITLKVGLGHHLLLEPNEDPVEFPVIRGHSHSIVEVRDCQVEISIGMMSLGSGMESLIGAWLYLQHLGGKADGVLEVKHLPPAPGQVEQQVDPELVKHWPVVPGDLRDSLDCILVSLGSICHLVPLEESVAILQQLVEESEQDDWPVLCQ